jgi:catechol 2,3-dioxygenase
MKNSPLDFQGLLAEAEVEALAQEPMKTGTRIGHIHLQVDDLAKAKQFYAEVVGFAPVSTFPGAQFLGAGGYHHHLAANVWDSRDGPPPSPDKAGLSLMTFEMPDPASMAALRSRLEAANVATSSQEDGFNFADPWRTPVAVRPAR